MKPRATEEMPVPSAFQQGNGSVPLKALLDRMDDVIEHTRKQLRIAEV